MIFSKSRLFSFLALICCATLLISCFEKKSDEAPARIEDDKVSAALDKEIKTLTSDKEKMQLRMNSARVDLEENALRPKLLAFIRKEYFGYEKMDRQIDQQIAYYKIKKVLRDKDVQDRLSKITRKDLEKEMADYEISIKANPPVFPWRKLADPEKPTDKKAVDRKEIKRDSKDSPPKKPLDPADPLPEH